MLLELQIAQYEAVAPEGKKLPLVLFWTVFRIMQPGHGEELYLHTYSYKGKFLPFGNAAPVPWKFTPGQFPSGQFGKI